MEPLQAEMEQVEEEQIDQGQMKEAIMEWMRVIEAGMRSSIPTRNVRYINHPKMSDFLKLLEQMYTNMQNSRYNANARDFYHHIKWIQEQIGIESNKIDREYWQGKIKELSDLYGDQPMFWSRLKIMYCLFNTVNNRKCITGPEKRSLFNHTWREIFRITEEENSKFDDGNETVVENFLSNNEGRTRPYNNADLSKLNENIYLTRRITRRNIKDIVKEFKNKAPGKSGINKLILSNIPDIAVDVLGTLSNLALSMGYYVKIYKNGMLIFVDKPRKDSKIPIKYCPITLLEMPGKILEKLIYNRIMKHVDSNNKLHLNRYEFCKKKKRGTETALFRIYEIIAVNQKHSQQCNLICKDISKAFEKVWHRGLHYKILNLDLPLILEKILCNFTTDRRVQIKYENEIDEGFDILSGVPLDSVISPTLFIMYTSDIPPAGPGCTDVLFVDDITQVIQYYHGSKKFLARRTEREIARINNFEKKWKIQTNESKLQLLSISKTKPEKSNDKK